jgi:hypothetical protein
MQDLACLDPVYAATGCAVVAIMLMNMVMMTTIVTGSAKAVSVRCAEHLAYRGGAIGSTSEMFPLLGGKQINNI